MALVSRLLGGWVVDVFDHDDVNSWEPVFVVAGLLIGAFVPGRGSFDWPTTDLGEDGDPVQRIRGRRR